MFFDTLNIMLQKQNLSDYLFNKINLLKLNPAYKLQCFIVQVLGNDTITDGTNNFQCKFKKQAKKGSILRLIEWTLNLNSFDIIIQESQYLGGASYSVKSGKPWDIEKLKILTASSIISKDFLVLHNPSSTKDNMREQERGNQGRAKDVFKLPVKKQRIFSFRIKHEPSVHEKKYMVQPTVQNEGEQKFQSFFRIQPTQKQDKKTQLQSKNPDNLVKSLDISLQSAKALQQKIIENNELNTDVTSLKFSQSQIEKAKKLKAPHPSKTKNEKLGQTQKSKDTINEDSKGRQLIFNKQQIKKLLGEQ